MALDRRKDAPYPFPMKYASVLTATMIFLSSTPAFAVVPAATPSRQLVELRGDFERHLLEFYPTLADTLGVQGRKPALGDLSPEALASQSRYFESLQTRLEDLAGQGKLLSGQEKIDLAQMESAVEYKLHWLNDWKGPLRDLGDDAAGLLPSNVTQEQLATLSSDNAVAVWKGVSKRLENIDRYLDQRKDNLRKGLALGFKPNRRILESEIEESEDSAKFFAEEMLMKARSSLPPDAFSAQETILTGAADKAGKAYRDYAEFLKTELLPHAEETFAVGETEYEWRLKQMGIDKTPEELSREGLALAGDIRARMEKIAIRIAPGKSLAEVMTELKSVHPKDDQELFARYRETADRARRFVEDKKLFALPPGYSLSIIETPASMQALSSKAAYIAAPPLDPTKSGAFMVTPAKGDLKRLEFHNDATIPSVVVHEAFPGHSLQFFSFQHRGEGASDLPFFIKSRSDGVFGYSTSLNTEGYALYAEELMRKAGFYAPKEELAQLQMQLWRAYRIVVDAGLHTGKMSFDAAVQTLKDQVFMSLPSAKGEVLRYTTIPTQAVTYMIGRLQIERLKEKYRTTMGSYYDEREFHRALFEFGPVPPATIAPVMLEQARARRKSLDAAFGTSPGG